MTEEKLNRAKKIQSDLILAKEALDFSEKVIAMDLIFKTGDRYDVNINKVFYELIYPDLKLYIKTFCEIRLTMLIKEWEKELGNL